MKRWRHCMGCTAPWRQNNEVQRTIKRAELTAFLCLLRKGCGPIKIHVDNKGHNWTGYEEVIKSALSKSRRCGLVDKNLGRTT